jgi:hypothetical protein
VEIQTERERAGGARTLVALKSALLLLGAAGAHHKPIFAWQVGASILSVCAMKPGAESRQAESRQDLVI